MQEQSSLYRRWNPTKLSDVCGNAIAVAKCKTLIEQTQPSRRPGFYLITGETGTGKSTIAHILAAAFGCGDVASGGVRVFNSRDCGKVDFVSAFLTEEMPAASLVSRARAYIFEEAHNITVAAQEMFMEPMEKGIPPNTYVFFVTNCPERLTGGKGALVSRPFRIETCGLTPKDMLPRLTKINAEEGLGLTADDVASCAGFSGKSMRVAIASMERLSTLPAELRAQELAKIKLESDLAVEEVPANVRDLALAVEKGGWDGVAEVLRKMREAKEDPEGIRRALLAWHMGTLLSDKPYCRGKRKASRDMLLALKDNYYNTGFAGLVCDLSHMVREGI